MAFGDKSWAHRENWNEKCSNGTCVFSEFGHSLCPFSFGAWCVFQTLWTTTLHTSTSCKVRFVLWADCQCSHLGQGRDVEKIYTAERNSRDLRQVANDELFFILFSFFLFQNSLFSEAWQDSMTKDSGVQNIDRWMDTSNWLLTNDKFKSEMVTSNK